MGSIVLHETPIILQIVFPLRIIQHINQCNGSQTETLPVRFDFSH